MCIFTTIIMAMLESLKLDVVSKISYKCFFYNKKIQDANCYSN
jgi:hypothetical protein